MEFPEQVSRRGLRVLLVFIFFMITGFTMIMPLVAVHYVTNLGFTAATVGIALAVRQFVQQGLAIIGGALADHFGAKALISLGVLIRALGFGSLAWAETFPLLFIAMLVSALGGALFEVPYQAAIAALTTEEERPHFYSVSNLLGGVATTAGPLLGVMLLRVDFQLVCLISAACFGVCFLLAWLLLPSITVASEQHSLGYGMTLVYRDWPFLTLTGLLMGYWFTAVQINISMPLLAEQLTGTTDSVGLIFALNAGMTIVLQYPLIRLLERWLNPLQILVLGVVIMSLGIGALAIPMTFNGLLGCVGVFALGTLLTRPTQQTLTVGMADVRARGIYLGVSTLALAFGGSIGNVAGGGLIDFARQTGSQAMPWLVFSAVGLVSACGLSLLGLYRRHHSAAFE